MKAKVITQEINLVEKKLRHILRENLHCLVAHCCLLLENKVIDIQSDPERSVSNHEGFYPHSSDEGDGMERHVDEEILRC